jgi:thioredoxin reductase (NADPH)
MNNIHRGLPLARARIEQIFPKLTSTQIRRITPHGRTRTTKRGEVLSEQGDIAASFFVVVSGELEILRPSGAVETLVTVHRSASSLARSARCPADGPCSVCVSLNRVR